MAASTKTGLPARLGGVAASAVSRFFAAGCPQHAAGIAYRVLFSLAPLAIVLVSVFGLVLQDDDLRDSVVATIVDALPVDESGRSDVERAIEKIASPASAAGLVSLLVFLWAASGMMGAIRRGLEAATGAAEDHPAVHGKLLDLVLVLGAAVLVLLSVAVGFLAEAFGGVVGDLAADLGATGDVVERTVAVGLPLVLWIATALLLYRFVATARLRFADALAGALVTGALLVLISLASSVLYAKTADWSVIYGSLTGLLVFLYSVYLYASALLLGAAVAVEWSRPRVAGEGKSLAEQVRDVLRGLVVRRREPS